MERAEQTNKMKAVPCEMRLPLGTLIEEVSEPTKDTILGGRLLPVMGEGEAVELTLQLMC